MKLRSGKYIAWKFVANLLKTETQPFKLICLDEKIKDRGYGTKYSPIQKRKNPNVKLYRSWAKWVHYVNTLRINVEHF